MPFSTKVSPFNAPNYDVFQPARRSDERGVILGTPLDGTQAYVPWIGLTTVRELALKYPQAGLVLREELELSREAHANAEKLLAEALLHIEKLEAKQDRIAGLVSDGFKVQKIMGRPPVKEKV